jgi:PAS domain S-box-containing protein
MDTPAYEWLCRRIVEDSQDAIICADRDGKIRLWNAGAEAMFGYQAREVLGQSLDRLIPEKLQPRHDEGYRRVMDTGVTRYGKELLAVPGLRKDGSRISLEFTLTLIRGEDGRVLGAAAIIREVTVRREREQALTARLAALEAKAGTV